MDRNRLTIDQDVAGVCFDRAGQNFYQRRLTGAVLTDERMHFSRHYVEAHAVERLHAGIGFADPAHREVGSVAAWCGGAAGRHHCLPVYDPTVTGMIFGGVLPVKYKYIWSTTILPIWSGCCSGSPTIAPESIAFLASEFASYPTTLILPVLPAAAMERTAPRAESSLIPNTPDSVGYCCRKLSITLAA